MAIVTNEVLEYINKLYINKKMYQDVFICDPLFALSKYCIPALKGDNSIEIYKFPEALILQARESYEKYGALGIIKAYFKNRVIDPIIDEETERKIFILKKGLKALPSTKASIIFKGFGIELTEATIKRVYGSYGMLVGQREIRSYFDFEDINHRIMQLERLFKEPSQSKAVELIHKRFISWLNYYRKAEKSDISEENQIRKTLLYHYVHNVGKYGMLGLIDKSKKGFRENKIHAKHEAFIVINKIQHPLHTEKYYIDYLKYQQIKADRSSISKIFSRWQVSDYQSAFISNLSRLETQLEIETTSPSIIIPAKKHIERWINENFYNLLKGLKEYYLHVNSPGIFILWHYIEELGIFPILQSMGLTKESGVYHWINYFLYTIGRIFYGLASYHRGCRQEEPSISFFSQLVKPPCETQFLQGLSKISEEDLFKLQRWLVLRIKQLGLSNCKKIAFDFHQIDLDVEEEILKQLGKGPSWKKKICYSGFRPHIAWDVETGTLVVLEFRKSSARGTTTFKRFVDDFIKEVFKKNFEQVYIDSEYTGCDVWNYILDDKLGMGANLCGCIKQNKKVKKARDKFLLQHKNDDDFWRYWDEEHVYSKETFVLKWEYENPKTNRKRTLSLNLVVKKNIKTGKLRCFGSSTTAIAKEILENYDERWIIENGIKDLIQSYYLDKVPGITPHLVNIHFFIVSICRTLYRMIQRDIEPYIKNPDGTIKTLQTTRDILFRQGSARIGIKDGCIEIYLLNPYSVKATEIMRKLFDKANAQQVQIKLLGDFSVKFIIKPPHGEEFKNSRKQVILNAKNF